MNTRLLRLCVVVSCLFLFAQCNDSVTQSSNETDNTNPYLTSAEGDSSGISQESLSALIIPEDEDDQVALKPTFDWRSTEGAESYILHVSRGDEMIIEEEVKDSEFTPSFELSYGATYYWRVRPSNDTDSWTEIQSFTTLTEVEAEKQLEAPTKVSPKDGAEGVSVQPEIEWEAFNEAESYILHVSHGNDMIIREHVKNKETTFTPSAPLPADETYYWRVRAVNQGVKGEWSKITSFTTGSSEDSGSSDDTGDTGNTGTGGTGTDDSGDTGDSGSEDTSGDETTVSDGDVRAALMDLYEATGGDQWNNNSGWGDGEPSDSWHGIDVNSQGQITRIDLFNNGLSGELPESIGNLKNVKYLNLKNNNLTGPIPDGIGEMASLEYLILSGRTYEIGGTLKEPPSNLEYAYHAGKRSTSTNRFSGTIPSSIGQLSELQFLEISDQPAITGPIPTELGNLAKLKGLYLNMNDFDGYSIPESIGNLTELRHLYFSNSDISGQLPSGLKNLTKLTYINIVSSETRDKGLTGDLPDLSNLTNLRSLVLSRNELNGEYPAYFNNGNFTELHTLRITWNNLTGTLHGFDNLPAMESLGLEGNQLSGTIKEQLTELPDRLQIMGLGWNNFTGGLPQGGWQDFWQLKTLYLNDNELTGSISCDFWNKLDNETLIYAWLKNNNFTNNCTEAMNSVDGEGSRLSISVDGNDF